MVPRNTRTLIIKSAFPAGVSHAGVADIIGKSLSGQIDSIHVCPGGIIRVSFLALHKMACIRTLLQVVHSQYIYWYKTNIRMWHDI